MKSNIIIALGLLGLGLLGGCGGGGNNAATTAPTAHLAVTLPPGSIEAGTPFTFTVTALDATTAVVTTYVGTVSGTFTPSGFMNAARSAHTATLLDNGETLLAGGEGDATAELYP